MKKVRLLAVGVVAALSYVAAPSSAENVESGRAQPGGSMPAQAPVGPLVELTGAVSDIDHSSGLLTLASAPGNVRLHFPPASLETVRKCEPITVQYAFARGTFGEQLAYTSPAGVGEHRMTGTVTRVDHTNGWIQVQTEPGTLQLPFPPTVVRTLTTGDRVSIDLAFSKWVTHRSAR